MITIGSVTGFNTVTKTTASSPATAVGDMVLANAVGGVVTVTLPTAPPTNSQVVVKKIDTSANAVNVGAAANIDNVATVALTAPYAAATFTYDGAMWRVSSSTSNTAADVPTGGAAGQVLTKNSATNYDAAWAAAASSSSKLNMVSTSTNYNASANDFINGSCTNATVFVFLPSSPADGSLVGVRRVTAGDNYVRVNGNVNGVANSSIFLYGQGQYGVFQYNVATSTWITREASFVPTAVSGGSAGQVLARGDVGDFNVGWTSTGLVPTGGAAGQVLTKNSANNYDATWAAASTGSSSGGGFLQPWVSGGGRVFVAPPLSSGTSAQTMTVSFSNYQCFYPVRIPTACTISSISVFCSVSGQQGNPLFLALYSDVPTAGSGGPALRLAFGSGTIAAGANYPSTIPMSYTVAAPMNAWVSVGCAVQLSLICHTGAGEALSFLPGNGLATFSDRNTSALPTMRTANSVGYNSQTQDVSGQVTNAVVSPVPVFAFSLT